ncbi:MAG: TrgA family protein [Pseudomonadota bacterium]|nr:TrgA family protein [Pseudomonadota bacterium]
MARMNARRLPTFASLVAAILLAVLGVAVAEMTRPYFDEGTPLTWLHPVAAAMGVIVGWFFTGPKLQKGKGSPVAIGLTSAVVQALLTMFVFASDLMLTRALRNSYRTVMEAVAGVFEAMLDYGERVAQPDIVIALLVGGVIIAFITNWVARRTR